MRNVAFIMASLLVLVAGCCCRTQGTGSKTDPIAVATGRAVVAYTTTVPQLTSSTRKVAREIRKPVLGLKEGLPDVQRVSPRPIVAMAEQGDFYFYATSAATDQESHQPSMFIAGYAIKKGGREIIEWSVW